HMQTLPDKRLVSRTYQGKKYYVYSDPEGCKCVYIGDPAQYQSYQSIARQQQQAAPGWQPQQGVEEAREWEIENSGRERRVPLPVAPMQAHSKRLKKRGEPARSPREARRPTLRRALGRPPGAAPAQC